jgi:hypothetical protein
MKDYLTLTKKRKKERKSPQWGLGAWHKTQVVEHLPSKQEAWIQTPIPPKRSQKQKAVNFEHSPKVTQVIRNRVRTKVSLLSCSPKTLPTRCHRLRQWSCFPLGTYTI